MIVLYDADCGFCRWAMAWAMRQDQRNELVPAPIQSELGAELLAELNPTDRLRAAHAIGEDGQRRSGGPAVEQVLHAVRPGRATTRLTRRLPRVTNLLYGVVAHRRVGFGRFVGQKARMRADHLLEAKRITTRAELEARSPEQRNGT